MSWFHKTFRRNRKDKHRNARQPQKVPPRLSLEHLEERTLLSQSVELLNTMSIGSNTGEKPQSKVWRHDDTWWSVLPNSGGTFVWELAGTTWTQGLKLSTSTGAKADTKVVGDVTHALLYRGTFSQLASIEHVSGTYQLWSERPNVSNVSLSTGVETATIDIDSTGRMWLASDGVNTIEVRYSDAPYTTWSDPIVLESNVSPDDIAVVTALPNGNIGVLWSNQNTNRFGFRLHVDGDDPEVWAVDEVPASDQAQPIGGGMADDHLNVAVASDGTLYAAVKTSYNTPGQPVLALLVRSPAGDWTMHEVAQDGTRPIVVLDEATGHVRVIYTEDETGGDTLYKESAISPIQFGPSSVLIPSTSFNSPTSTKQNVTDELVVLAAAGGTVGGALVTFDGVPDQPPVVYAGPDQTVIGPNAGLNGSAIEGQPNPPGAMSTTWSQISGPGNAYFADASALDTTVSFDAPGRYLLRLTGLDGGLAGSDDIAITANHVSLTTQSFQDGALPTASYSGTRDTKLRASRPDRNYGSSPTLEMDGDPDEASLIKWDISSIPAGSHITAATITLNVTGTTSHTYELYEVKQDWAENSATWNVFSTGNIWEIAGAAGPSDRGSTVLGSAVSKSLGPVTIQLNAAGLALLESWLDNPATNYGFVLQDYTVTDSFDVSSSESTTLGNRPKLSVSYMSGGPPTISDIVDQSTSEDAAANTAFAVGDAESPAAELTVWGSSSNQMLVPNSSIVFGGSNADRTVTITPAPNRTGTATITVTVSDGSSTTSDSFVLTVTPAPVDNPPVAGDDNATTDEDTAVTISVLANDSDADIDPLAVVSVTDPASGTAAIHPDGTIIYTPDDNFHGSDSFDYTIDDGHDGSASATVMVSINPVNDAPSFVGGADQLVLQDAGAQSVPDWATDSSPGPADESGQTLTFNVTNDNNALFDVQPAVAPDGTLSYTPAAGASGSAMVTVTLQDEGGTANGGVDTSSAQSFQIIVKPVVAGSFQDGVSPDLDYALTRDARIRADLPGGNFGSVTTLFADGSPTDFAALLQWDVSSILSGSVVLSVSITVNVVDATSQTYPIYELKRDWIESEVTWNSFSAGNAWEDDGAEGAGDRGATVLGQITGPQGSTSIALNPDGVAVVQSWINDPASNHGVIIQNYSDLTDSAIGISSRESLTETTRPKLSIVYAPNHAPAAVADAYDVSEDGVFSVAGPGVLGNDTDGDADAIVAILTSAPNHGTLSLGADGSFAYTPDTDFNGLDSFTYKAHDGLSDSNVTMVTLTISAVNDAPVPAPDSTTTDEDMAVTISVLANDSDVDGDPLTVASVTDPAGGTATINADGTITYTPDGDFHGSDSFDYTIDDGHGGSASATVMVSIDPVNDAPAGGGDSATIDEDMAVTISVLANDFDADGDPLTVASVTDPAGGTATINADGTITFTSDDDFHGSDSFEYTIADGQGGSASATVMITINPVNDEPVAGGDSATTDEEMAVTISVLANDADVDGDPLSVASLTDPAGGTATINPDGSITYTPDGNFHGSDSFDYTIDDGHGGSASATVMVSINPVNDEPVAGGDSAATDEDMAVTISVLANDTDVDGDPLSVSSVTDPAGGTATINADGTITYTPDDDFHGSDSFDYTIDDGHGGSATATVMIEVNPANDEPVASGDSATTDEDVAVTISVLANDADVDGDLLSVASVTDPAGGTAAVNLDGTITYTPDVNFHGSDSFDYTIDDGNGGSATATVMIEVNPINDAPLAGGDDATTDEDLGVTISVLANDSEVDGDLLSVTSATDPAGGTTTVNPDGTITYTPDDDFHGSDSFDYTIDDGQGGSASATVMVTVNAINDEPVAGGDSATTDEDVAVTISVLANDADVDGDRLTIASLTTPAGGTAAINPDGTITYTPNANFNGSDSFDYTIDDGHGGSNSDTVMISINPVNDAPSFVGGADQLVLQDAGAQTVPGQVTDLSPGPADESGQALAFNVTNDNNALFDVPPAIASDGTLSYIPAAGASGSATVTVMLQDDGGTANGGVDTSAAQSFQIIVKPVVAGSFQDGVSPDPAYAGTSDARIRAEFPDNNYGSVSTLFADGSPALAALLKWDLSSIPSGSVVLSVSITVNVVDATSEIYEIYELKRDWIESEVTWNSFSVGNAWEDDGAEGTSDRGPAVLGTITGPHGPATIALNSDGVAVVQSWITDPSSNYGIIIQDYTTGNAIGISSSEALTATYRPKLNITYAPNHAPTAVADAYDVLEDGVLSVAGPGVLGNDSDSDADAIDAILMSAPANGTLTLAADGSFTYTPDADFNGTDSFTYKAHDSLGGSSVATVTLTVHAVNDSPSFVPGPDQTVPIDAGPQSVLGWATVIGPGPADESWQTLTFVTSNDSNELFDVHPAITPEGNLIYTPAPGATGTATVTVMLVDDGGTDDGGLDSSLPQVFTITIENIV